MAGIFDRIGMIVKSNLNELLDKFEDPEKIIDQTIIDAVQEYGSMKKAAWTCWPMKPLLKSCWMS